MTTTSLPILPSRQALPRPKLRLDTQQVRTFGKGSTSLRLDTLSAVSPTVRNTFSNAYEQSASKSPVAGRPQRPRLCIDSTVPSSDASTPNSASTLSSSLTSASTDSATIVIPYKQPHNLTSILANSPARSLAPRKMAPVRPLFPAEKRVSFRTPLEEEIKTVKYTMAHSDIESSCSTLSSLSTTASSESEASEASLSISTASSSSDAPSSPLVQSPSKQSGSTFSSLESSPRPRGPRAGDKRDSSESDSDSCPETPVAGRRKRRRNWTWTLGPIPLNKSASASSSSSSSSISIVVSDDSS